MAITQLSASFIPPLLQMSSRLMVLELLLSTTFDPLIDLQRFAAVDSWMRFVWLALCPALFFVLLPKMFRGWWRCWYCCCCVGPERFECALNDSDKSLWFCLSCKPELDVPLPQWIVGALRLKLAAQVVGCSFDWATVLRYSWPLGHMVESNTSIELVIAWSHRQQSMNSSIVTTPSWLRSIFCRI